MFSQDVLISLINNARAVNQIEVGEYVYSLNTQTMRRDYHMVTAIHRAYKESIVRISGEIQFECSVDQLFLTLGDKLELKPLCEIPRNGLIFIHPEHYVRKSALCITPLPYEKEVIGFELEGASTVLARRGGPALWLGSV